MRIGTYCGKAILARLLCTLAKKVYIQSWIAVISMP
jgi:hypothetical protein